MSKLSGSRPDETRIRHEVINVHALVLVGVWDERVHHVDVAVSTEGRDFANLEVPDDAAALPEDDLVVGITKASHGRQHLVDSCNLKGELPLL